MACCVSGSFSFGLTVETSPVWFLCYTFSDLRIRDWLTFPVLLSKPELLPDCSEGAALF